MPGKPPKFRAFLTDETGKRILEDENGKWIEFAALWESDYPDKNGNPVYQGRTGKGDQKIRLYVNAPRDQDNQPQVSGDVPF